MSQDTASTTPSDPAVVRAAPLFAFFRSLEPSGMTSDGGYSYQPAGIVVEKYADGCPSGKDIVVMFLDPFDVRVVSQWRAINEVELIMVNEWEWRSVRESYARLDEANV